ncbi:hypothetical protein ALP10_200074 [Pseudomonas syringae pv. helianthi]|uniref:Uncharacterized protein n=1 Tax=Pseudomonas syringae pv. helianthi TaxID=251654 RepID=A0A3M6CXK1_9PSED|nr:hypothetical protein ALP10_200074 [Pseudomonas syringae pv. helianthi]
MPPRLELWRNRADLRRMVIRGVFVVRHFAVDHQAEAFTEFQIIDIRRGVLLAQRLDHPVHAHDLLLLFQPSDNSRGRID